MAGAAPMPHLDEVMTYLHKHNDGACAGAPCSSQNRLWQLTLGNSLPPNGSWLLQTPNCWGRTECGQPPPGGVAFLQAMTNMIAGAQRSVDISALLNHTGYGGPSDAFVKAIADGLNRAKAAGYTPMVRLLIGVYPTLSGIHLPLNKNPVAYRPEAFAHKLQAMVKYRVEVQSGYMRTGIESFDHAKVLDVDGRAAIVGGMNYWSEDYFDTPYPVNDVSMQVTGPAARFISQFDDKLWLFTCIHRLNPLLAGVSLLNKTGCTAGINTLAPVVNPNGVPILVVTKLGNGTFPGEPRGVSRRFTRPPVHGNICKGFPEKDFNEVNGGLPEKEQDALAYEWRNPGEDALRGLILGAKRSIFISQQDLLSCGPYLGHPLEHARVEAKFDERLFSALATKIEDRVPIQIVLSAAKGGADDGYGNGYSLSDVARTLKEMVERQFKISPAAAREKVCQDVNLLHIRNALNDWPKKTPPKFHQRFPTNKPFSNHAKLVAVDVEGSTPASPGAFYIGSGNLYPSRLQEAGFIVEDYTAALQLKSAYLDQTALYSQSQAYIDKNVIDLKTGKPRCPSF
jgi:phosphatidylserine/phosphatidylglycerophosphate/cardiolipin synthase-like enzyme